MSDPDYRDPAVLEELYHDRGMTQKEIADELGCSGPTVSIQMKRHGIETDQDERGRGEEPVRMERPRGYSAVSHHNHVVYIHRLVAVAKYGYDAVTEPGVEVHHDRGISFGNGFDNIELKIESDHSMLHAEERHNIGDTSYREKGTLIWLHENLGMNPTEIADCYTVTPSTIRYWLRKHDIVDTDDDTTPSQPGTVDKDPQSSLSEFTEPATN